MGRFSMEAPARQRQSVEQSCAMFDAAAIGSVRWRDNARKLGIARRASSATSSPSTPSGAGIVGG